MRQGRFPVFISRFLQWNIVCGIIDAEKMYLERRLMWVFWDATRKNAVILPVLR
jgi:hypothetical protein